MGDGERMKPKVVIVAGGLATRMRPVTEDMPKCMLDVNGKPLVQHQMEFFRKNGFYNFILCIMHIGEKVESFFKDGSDFGVKIEYSHEDRLFGTAGAVKLVEGIAGDTCIVFYGDNLTSMNFDSLLEFHRARESDFTVVSQQIPKGKITSSLLTLGDTGKITLFIEKPEESAFETSNALYYNRGIYVMNKNIFSLIPKNAKYDFGHDLIPDLVKRGLNIYAYVTDEFFHEFGRPENYRKFLAEFKNKRVL